MPNLGVYIPDQLSARLQRLREKGIDLNASNVARRALEVAVEAEERAMAGDRVPRLLARLASTKTAREVAEAEAVAAGRSWAEEIAALSELKAIERLLNKMESEQLEVYEVRAGGPRISLEFIQWEPESDSPTIVGDHFTLPESVPSDFFERARQPDEKKVMYLSLMAAAFMRGAADVLHVAEQAMARESDSKKVDAFRKALTGSKARRNSLQK